MNAVVIFHAKFHQIFVVVEGDVLVVMEESALALLPAFDEAAEAAAAMAIERPWGNPKGWKAMKG